MTSLSININKIALLRNSRGRNYPDLGAFAARLFSLGADDITLHPRPDQRHARYQDVKNLAAICDEYGKELNVEGYPTPEFLAVVKQTAVPTATIDSGRRSFRTTPLAAA
nr:pyridoxine 5'-phosphate synthase [uncultured Pseudomonas sp.]